MMGTDKRGFPITFTSIEVSPGVYDFTTTDPRKWMLVVGSRACGLCGVVMKEDIWFIGGPKCMKFRMFYDPPMHEECARYALVVCPYLAMPKYLGAKTHLVPEQYRVPIVSSDKEKPDRFGLVTTKGYKPVMFQGDTLILADEWTRPIEWWKDGAPLSQGGTQEG